MNSNPGERNAEVRVNLDILLRALTETRKSHKNILVKHEL
jgi:hypothetical protein